MGVIYWASKGSRETWLCVGVAVGLFYVLCVGGFFLLCCTVAFLLLPFCSGSFELIQNGDSFTLLCVLSYVSLDFFPRLSIAISMRFSNGGGGEVLGLYACANFI